jgi:hypothetical protein
VSPALQAALFGLAVTGRISRLADDEGSMMRILTALHLSDPSSLKRALTTGISAVMLITINPFLLKVGLAPLSDGVIASVAGVVAIYVLQSGLKSRAIANANHTAHDSSNAIRPKTPAR